MCSCVWESCTNVCLNVGVYVCMLSVLSHALLCVCMHVRAFGRGYVLQQALEQLLPLFPATAVRMQAEAEEKNRALFW